MSEPIDVALIGGGIMSATLGSLLQQLEPTWNITSSSASATSPSRARTPGTTPAPATPPSVSSTTRPSCADGTIDISSAVKVNEQFQVSRQFWSYLLGAGTLPQPERFINAVPHMSFVWGEENVAYLKKRYEALKDHPLFAGLEYSEDASVIRSWAPLLIPGRQRSQPIAATRIAAGTDVDFGALTRLLLDGMMTNGAKLKLEHRVTGLHQRKDGTWKISLRHEVGGTPIEVDARFVFVGAGGAALNLLQRSGIREIRGYGGFPISGQFLRTDDPAVVAKHAAKVYGKAAKGSPPMSVPHLDTRVVDGKASLLFGPVRRVHARSS